MEKEPLANSTHCEIEFLIIGAQKSGTTAFFKYLSQHPDIYMPPEKEVEFFHDDKKFNKGKAWYYNTYFANAGEQILKGEASTHYMMYGNVPERIHGFYPGIKLIALLRNPVERAYSHYKMAVRRGVEDRSFHECVVQNIGRGPIPDTQVDHNRDYVLFGEYGRILQHYLKWFNKDQIMVVFSEDLINEPLLTIQRVYSFLGASADFVPSNLGKKYHVSGRQRIPGLTTWVRRRVEWLKRQKWASWFIWRINFEAFIFWLETEFNVKQEKDDRISPETNALLAKYYSSDILLLESLLGIKTPWKISQ